MTTSTDDRIFRGPRDRLEVWLAVGLALQVVKDSAINEGQKEWLEYQLRKAQALIEHPS